MQDAMGRLQRAIELDPYATWPRAPTLRIFA